MTVAELQSKLKGLPEEMRPQVVKAMTKSCLKVQALAKQNCTPGQSPYDWMEFESKDGRSGAPYDTGMLMRSITYRVDDTKTSVDGRVGTNLEYSLYVHEGTSKMPSRPFLSDAIASLSDEIIDNVGEALKE